MSVILNEPFTVDKLAEYVFDQGTAEAGMTVAGTALFTIPPGTRPKAKVNPTGFSYDLIATGAQTAARCSINSAGVAALNVAVLKGSFLYFDGFNWNLT